MKRLILLLATLVFGVCAFLPAQNLPIPGPTPVQLTQGLYYQTAISATNAINTQTTLTIPAPQANLYNYVCWLGYNASQNATSTVQTNAVTTSTNFGGFAIKYSLAATVNISYDWQQTWGTPIGGGCAKSTSPGTATTFVSPVAGAQIAFTWYATYYQGY